MSGVNLIGSYFKHDPYVVFFYFYNWNHCVFQAAAGQIQNCPTLSFWWSWVPLWSLRQPPARFAPPTFQTRSYGATSSSLSSPSAPQGNMWPTLPFLTKWEKPNRHWSLRRRCHQVAHQRILLFLAVRRRRELTLRRKDWKRATGGKREVERGGASETAAHWVFASVTSEMKEAVTEKLIWNWDEEKTETTNEILLLHRRMVFEVLVIFHFPQPTCIQIVGHMAGNEKSTSTAKLKSVKERKWTQLGWNGYRLQIIHVPMSSRVSSA